MIFARPFVLYGLLDVLEGGLVEHVLDVNLVSGLGLAGSVAARRLVIIKLVPMPDVVGHALVHLLEQR